MAARPGPPKVYTPEELAHLPHNTLGPELLGVSWSMTGLATVLVGLRLYCKFVGNHRLWWDDHVIIAAWMVLVTDVSLSTVMVVRDDYGAHTWDFHPRHIDDFVLMAAVRATLAVTAIVWTKTAFAVTLLRLTAGRMKMAVWFFIVSMNVLMGVTALLFWVQCTPLEKVWRPAKYGPRGTCLDYKYTTRYDIFTGAYSGLMDFVLAFLPWKLFADMQMRKMEKIGVAVAMSFGAIAGVVAIIKSVKLPKLDNDDVYERADLVIWDILEAALSMVGACIPFLRVLLKEVRTRYFVSHEEPNSHQSGGRTWKESASRRGGVTTTTITGHHHRHAKSKSDDLGSQDWASDKSILDDGSLGLARTGGMDGRNGQANRIVRTDELDVEYGRAVMDGSKGKDGHHGGRGDVYELRNVGGRGY